LNQPMKRVSRRRGIRLVRRKLTSSWRNTVASVLRIVMKQLAPVDTIRDMDSRSKTLALYAQGAGALTGPLVKLKGRIALSKAKHRSLTGHARMAQRVAALVPFYEYDENRFFRADGAPEEIALCREAGFMRLKQQFQTRFTSTAELTDEVRDGVSD